MKVQATPINPYPGYEKHVKMNLRTDEGGHVDMSELQKSILAYKLGEGTTMEDRMIPGTEAGTEMKIRVIRPAGLPENAPIVMDIHGGGFVSGNLDIDNYRNIFIAEHTPCIVVSVEYRLASKEFRAPGPMLDCYTAYCWVREHAGEIGGDAKRIGLHGTSAGGNLVEALCLYLRDRGEEQPELAVLVNPGLTIEKTVSKYQFGTLGNPDGKFADMVDAIYVGPDGGAVSYYAMPAFAPTLQGLCPHMVIAAEYDPLRDEALHYALRLLEDGVPTEIYSAPGVTHGFTVLDHPLSHWTMRGMCASFRRAFRMEITEF